MNRWMSYFLEFCAWVAMLLLLGLGGVMVAVLAGRIQPPEQIIAVLLQRRAASSVVAVILIIIAFYFGGLIVQAHRQRQLITHAGARGAIRISPQAVRDFVVRVLEEELDLPDCRVRLRPGVGSEGALTILVRIPLPLGQNIIEVGERMQDLLKARVEERIGIAVVSVEVIAAGMPSRRAAAEHGAPSKKGSYITRFSESDFEGELRE